MRLGVQVHMHVQLDVCPSARLSPERDTDSKQDSYGRPLTVCEEGKERERKLKSDIFCS